MKKRLIVVLASALAVSMIFSGCGKQEIDTAAKGETETAEDTAEDTDVLTTGLASISGDSSGAGIYLDMSIEEFNDLGFEFGDSVNVYFDNGKSIEDIPYYSGYYTPVDGLLLVGYPGSDCVKIGRNYGVCTLQEYGLTEDSMADISLNERGKYADIQELYNLEYSDNRDDYASDVIFANFREVRGGNLQDGMVYRSASPCDNEHNRASYANRLAEENGIGFVLNMSDNEEKYKSYTENVDFESIYYNALYEDGKVLLLDMNANYRSDEFAQTLSKALAEMSENEGPVLIHCVEGKDRTGFACALILALADASPEEIIDDYMITYYNYYGVKEEENPERYAAIAINAEDFIYYLSDTETGTPFEELDLKSSAENYLRKGGLSDEEIQRIEEYVCGLSYEMAEAA